MDTPPTQNPTSTAPQPFPIEKHKWTEAQLLKLVNIIKNHPERALFLAGKQVSSEQQRTRLSLCKELALDPLSDTAWCRELRRRGVIKEKDSKWVYTSRVNDPVITKIRRIRSRIDEAVAAGKIEEPLNAWRQAESGGLTAQMQEMSWSEATQKFYLLFGEEEWNLAGKPEHRVITTPRVKNAVSRRRDEDEEDELLSPACTSSTKRQKSGTTVDDDRSVEDQTTTIASHSDRTQQTPLFEAASEGSSIVEVKHEDLEDDEEDEVVPVQDRLDPLHMALYWCAADSRRNPVDDRRKKPLIWFPTARDAFSANLVRRLKQIAMYNSYTICSTEDDFRGDSNGFRRIIVDYTSDDPDLPRYVYEGDFSVRYLTTAQFLEEVAKRRDNLFGDELE